ncbi:MAG: phage shock protein PspA [Opitutales bacterium]
MGIFSRFSDIVSSNLNAMLDKAEDPEKLIKLMISEMEDTLVELKASCAGVIASRAKAQRSLADAEERMKRWTERAQLAVDKGREDLAREALLEKRACREQINDLTAESENLDQLVTQYKSDIAELSDKLAQARKKNVILVQRHIHANKKQKAQTDIRKAQSAEAMMRFDKFESRIDRMEADADLINYRGGKPTTEDEFTRFETDDEIEKELDRLKKQAEERAARKNER